MMYPLLEIIVTRSDMPLFRIFPEFLKFSARILYIRTFVLIYI